MKHEAGFVQKEFRALRTLCPFVTPIQEWFHESRRLVWLDQLALDHRGAVRNLLKYPVACSVAIISLAGGIGATTAALMVRDVLFYRPPILYREPGQLSYVQLTSPTRPGFRFGGPVAGALYAAWQDSERNVRFAAATPEHVSDIRAADRMETIRVRSATPEFFSTLGISPVLGRTFAETGAGNAGSPVMLSYRLWETLFDKRDDAIGQVIWLGDRSFTVIGVLPSRFWFLQMDSPVWTLLDRSSTRSEAALEVVVRRPTDVSSARLAERLQPALNAYAAQLSSADRELRLRVLKFEGTPTGAAVSLALPYLLGMSVLLTLLIACANVAILVIAQWTAREHEIAIRASLGASRGRIMRSLLAESLLMALAGGVLGIMTTDAIRGIIVSQSGPASQFFDLSIDPRVLFESGLIAVLTGIIAGIGPALLETRRLHGNPMRTLASSDRVRQRWRHALVVMEIAVTVALLVVASTMLGGYRRSFTADLGYRTHSLINVRVENQEGVPTARILDALGKMPELAGAAASTSAPFATWGPMQKIATDAAGSRVVPAELATISPAFFSTLDVPMREGRAFTRDDQVQPHTAIVNQTLATRLYPGLKAIGQSLYVGSTAYEVVGVVADYSNNTFQPQERDPKAYLTFAQGQPEPKQRQFVIRAIGDPIHIVRDVRQQIVDAAAGNTIGQALTIDQIIDVGAQEILVGTAPLAPLTITGLVLTTAGIYGVLAFAITRRSKELAVRVAIGASGRDLVRLVSAHSFSLIATGAVTGVGVTFALGRIVRASGGAGSLYDPAWTSFVAPLAIIAIVGAVATWIPARRATRVNPSNLLRTT